jgi:hypothetical protein
MILLVFQAFLQIKNYCHICVQIVNKIFIHIIMIGVTIQDNSVLVQYRYCL